MPALSGGASSPRDRAVTAASSGPAAKNSQRRYVPRAGSSGAGASLASAQASASQAQMAAHSVTDTPRQATAGTFPIGLIARYSGAFIVVP